MKIATSSLYDMWQSTNSDGTITESELFFTAECSSSTDKAYLYKRVKARPSEVLKVRVTARAVSGSGKINIDYPIAGQSVNYLIIDKPYWNTYEVSYTTPYNADTTAYYQIAAGIFSDLTGEVEISNISIMTDNPSLPTLKCWGAGLIYINQLGEASINTNFTCSGISSVDYDSTTTTLTVNVEDSEANYNGINPIIQVSRTYSSDTNNNIIPMAAQYVATSGEFSVRFVNATTGDFADPTEISGGVYIWTTVQGY